jgi:hypothetical protein
MQEHSHALGAVKVGSPMTVNNLSVFPLLTETDHAPDYITLAQALEAGTGVITEVSTSGSVPQAVFRNLGDKPVLLLDGEELIGCKQNRILNLTIMAAPNAETLIPVTCVEMGRWSSISREFRPSKRFLFAELRAEKVAQVNRHMSVSGEKSADQGEVWRHLSMKSERMGSSSSSSAMSGIYEQREREIERDLAALRTEEGQVGAVFAINGEVVGIDLFDSASTLQSYFERVASGYVLDAVDRRTEQALQSEMSRRGSANRSGEDFSEYLAEPDRVLANNPAHEAAHNEAPPSVESVQSMLRRTAGVTEKRFPGVGIGEDIRLDTPAIAGAALVVSERLVHLCAFDMETSERSQYRNRRAERRRAGA